MNYIDLFHGIGGFALGAYWAGMKYENHYCSDIEPKVVELYKKRFPDSIQLGDIREIDCEKIMADTERSDAGSRTEQQQNEKSFNRKSTQLLSDTSSGSRETEARNNNWIITGGFPCQDISVAGKGTGIRGHRSGLWFEMWRIIRDLRPRFAIMENVGALTFRGLTDVLGSLTEIGYDAEWQDIRAEDMGAPHRRERIWIVAYPSSKRERGLYIRSGKARQTEIIINGKGKEISDTMSDGRQQRKRFQGRSCSKPERMEEISNSLSINDDNGRHGTSEICRQRSEKTDLSRSKELSDSEKPRIMRRERTQANADRQIRERGRNGNIQWWESEPTVGRLAHGVPGRVDRLKGLGNSIVPQIAELLFRQIKEQI